MPYRVSSFGPTLRALLLLCVAAACAPCAHAAATPSILRTDVFVAKRYNATTALVFFNSVMIPAGAGVPAGAMPAGVASWVGPSLRLELAPSGTEERWSKLWPGGASFAPQVGSRFVLALGGSASVRGILSNVGYLPSCNSTWLIGLVSVDAADRTAYAGANADGIAAYPSSPEILQAIANVAHATSVPAALVTKDNEHILNTFPLALLPMLDQAEGDNGVIVLTVESGPAGLLFSLKRQTPAGLIPTGVYFENRCTQSAQ